MLRKLAFMVAISPVLWFSAAQALGLGEIDVKSRLNQRFSATIPMTAVTSDEAESLLVRIADNDDFAKAGIDRADYLSALNFEVKMDGGNPRIVISSKQIAREPFLSFLLDVRGKNGRVLREYTVLLDPPSYADSAAPTAAPAKSNSDFYQTAEESAQAPKPAPPVEMVKVPAQPPVPAAPAPAPAMATDDTSTGTYGPVQAQETFWSIASKLRPNPSLTMDQVMWALYSNNTGAFEGGRIGGLLKGSVLKVPSASQMAAVNADAAKARMTQLRGGHGVAGKPHKAKAPVSKPVAQPAIATPEPAVAPAPKPEPKPQAKPVPPAPAAAAPAEKKTPENAPAAAVAAPPKPAAAPVPAPATAAAAEPPKAETPAPAAVTAASPSATTAAQAPAESPAPAAVPADQAAAATPPPAETPPIAPAPVTPAPEAGSWMDDLMLPGGLLLVLLLGAFGYRSMKQKKDKGDKAPDAKPEAKPSAFLQFLKRKPAAESKAPPAGPPRNSKFSMPPPVPTAPAVPKPSADPLAQTVLDKKADKASLTQTLASTLASTTLAQTIKDETLTETAQLPSFDSTQIFETSSDPLASSINTDTVDFDIAGKFEAETLKIDLDANDPVSEADFHLAYGLYDEAAMLLESAAEKDPGRSDIRVKLAETYFRAAKPHEFEEVAQSLKSQLDAAEWQKIAIMGSQLLPDSPLFKGAMQNAVLSEDVDLAFGEPESPAPVAPAAAAKMSSTGAFNASGAYSASNSSVLDFKLEDLEPMSKPAPAAQTQAKPESESRVPTGNTLEFNLAEFDLSKPGEPAAAAAPAAVPDTASETLAFDLGDDFKAPAADALARADLSVDAAEDIKLDDFDLGELPQDSHAISGGDEAGTKLDLARAYVDMGDNEMARSLLDEVLQQGTSEQKKDAQALIQRLA